MVYDDCKDPMLDISESRPTAPHFAFTGMVRRGNAGLEYWTREQRRQVLNMLRSNFNNCYFAGQCWLRDHQFIVFKYNKCHLFSLQSL